MSSAKFAGGALIVSVLFGAAAVPQARAAPPDKAVACVFDKYAPVAAAPYRSDNGIDYGSYSFLGGAQLFVPAREGLTKEWLAASVQAVVDRAAAEPALEASASSAGCESPRVKDVSVRVVSGGTGFWVQLISADQHSSDALLKWACGVADQHKTAPQAR